MFGNLEEVAFFFTSLGESPTAWCAGNSKFVLLYHRLRSECCICGVYERNWGDYLGMQGALALI